MFCVSSLPLLFLIQHVLFTLVSAGLPLRFVSSCGALNCLLIMVSVFLSFFYYDHKVCDSFPGQLLTISLKKSRCLSQCDVLELVVPTYFIALRTINKQKMRKIKEIQMTMKIMIRSQERKEKKRNSWLNEAKKGKFRIYYESLMQRRRKVMNS